MIINYTSKRRHRPDVLGTNLVSNPGPFNNTTGWAAGNSATLSAVSGKLRIARNGVTNPYAYQDITLEAGELYLFSESHIYSSGNPYLELYDSTTVYNPAIGFSSNGSKNIFFKALSTSIQIRLYCLTLTGTEYSDFYGLSLKKITTVGHGDDTNLIVQPFYEVVIGSVDPWDSSSSTLSVNSGKLRITNSGATNGVAYCTIPTIPGRSYSFSALYTEETATLSGIYIESYYASGGDLLQLSMTTTGTIYTDQFTAIGTETFIRIVNSAENNAYNSVSAITVTQADSSYTIEPDSSIADQTYPAIGGWEQISIGGNQESNFGREDEIWSVTTGIVATDSALDDWKEFLASVKGGETFTVDQYQDERPELITNGTFDTATTGWTAIVCTPTISNRKLRWTNTGAFRGSVTASFATTIGEEYEYYLDVDVGTSTATDLYIGTSLGSGENQTQVLSVSKTYTGTFLATATTTYFCVYNDSTSGHYSEIDNVSIKSVATDNPVSAIMVRGSDRIERVSQFMYRVSFSYRVI